MAIQVTVIGDSYADPDKYDFCVELGKMLAEMKAVVITGGRSGVMEAVSKGAFQAGGLTIGILPGDAKKEANAYCSVVLPTGLGNSRNALTVMAADIVIAVGGQGGTLTELGFAWISDKPVIAVGKFGGWSEKMSGKAIDSRRSDKIMGVNTLDEIRGIIEKIR
jgi:uncharacterized protein (TIGR00725 family)